MRWTWNAAKDEENLQKHRISFETAALVFEDPDSLTREDPYSREQRWRTMGMIGTVVVIVVHTWPEADTGTNDEVGRIISARKATSHERKAYEEEKD